MKRNDIIMLTGFGAATLSTLFFYFDKRKSLIRVAKREVGKARTDVYTLDTLGYTSDKDWCGMFILWALHQVGLAKDWKWEVEKGFLYKLNKTLVPKPGDIAYFNKYQHEALISRVDGDNIYLINGNGMNGVVTESVTNKGNVTAFYSIQKLLDK